MHTPDPRPEPQPAAPAPLCIDCKHHSILGEGIWRKNESSHRCSHPALRDPVDGRGACCQRARMVSSQCGQCGPEGRLFSPVQPTYAEFLEWWLGSPLPAPGVPDAPSQAEPGAGTPTPAPRPDAANNYVFLSGDSIPFKPGPADRRFIVVETTPEAPSAPHGKDQSAELPGLISPQPQPSSPLRPSLRKRLRAALAAAVAQWQRPAPPSPEKGR